MTEDTFGLNRGVKFPSNSIETLNRQTYIPKG